MNSYYLIEQYNKKGTLGISKNVFEFVGDNILKNIESILLISPDKKKKSKCQVSITFNKVTFNYTLICNKGVNKETLKSQIEAELTNSLFTLFDGIPFSLNVKFVILKA